MDDELDTEMQELARRNWERAQARLTDEECWQQARRYEILLRVSPHRLDPEEKDDGLHP